jgi:hypothetical protein
VSFRSYYLSCHEKTVKNLQDLHNLFNSSLHLIKENMLLSHESISKLWLLVMPVALFSVIFGFVLIIVIIMPSNAVLFISNNYIGTSNFAYG